MNCWLWLTLVAVFYSCLLKKLTLLAGQSPFQFSGHTEGQMMTEQVSVKVAQKPNIIHRYIYLMDSRFINQRATLISIFIEELFMKSKFWYLLGIHHQWNR